MISPYFIALANHLWQSTFFVAGVWLLTLALVIVLKYGAELFA